MGLLNKSFRDIKKDFSTGQGWSNSLFKTTITQNDFQNLQKFNSAINNTNDGLTKSQRITKAWNANMTGCSIAAKRMGNDLVTGKKTIKDISAAMDNASTSTKALGIAMNVLANVGLMLAITAVTKVISELSQAQEKAVQMAKEATESYKDEISSISDYKTRLSELHKELNSGNLSYEETKTKRSELMSIQDELIKKFGTEKTAIEAVTKAIDGQVKSLDDLNEKSYRDWFAKSDKVSFWNFSGKSGLDRAIDYMESDQTISFFDMANANSMVSGQYADLNAIITEEVRTVQEEIDKTIQSKYNLEKEFATFKLTGTPDEIKAQLEAIRQDYIDLSKDAFLDNGISSEYWEAYRSEAIDSINKVINKLDDGLTKHQDTYRTYIEGMIKYDSKYSDEYATILQKRAELESAQNSGNKEEIQKARQSFMEAISKGIEASGANENVKKYFETLYPELQAEFTSWNFEFSLNANTDGIKDIATQIGEKYTATNLLDMINTEGVQEGEDSFNNLIDKAIEYGICTDNSAEEVQKLIDLLVELGIVQGEISSENLNKMTASLEKMSDASKGISTIAKAFDELNSDDGFISIETIASIKEELGDSVENWEEYERILLTAKKGSAKASEAITDLTYAMLDQKFAGMDLTSVSEEYVAAILRENGVTNDVATAHDYLMQARAGEMATSIAQGNTTAANIQNLMDEAGYAGQDALAMYDLVAAEIYFNNHSLDVTQKVNALYEIAAAAGVARNAIISATDLNAAMQKQDRKYTQSSYNKLAELGITYTENKNRTDSNKTSKNGHLYHYNGADYEKREDAIAAAAYDKANKGIDSLSGNSSAYVPTIPKYTPTNDAKKAAEDAKRAEEERQRKELEALQAGLDARKKVLERYKASIELTDFGLELIDEDDFGLKSNLLSEKLDQLTTYGKKMRAEFDRVAATIPKTGDQADALGNRLEELGSNMRSNISEIRKTQTELRKLSIDMASTLIEDRMGELTSQMDDIDRQIDILNSDYKNDYRHVSDMLSMDMLLPSYSDFGGVRSNLSNKNRDLIRGEQETQNIINDIIETQIKKNEDLRESERRAILADMETMRSDVQLHLNNVSEDYEGSWRDAQITTDNGIQSIEKAIDNMDMKIPEPDISNVVRACELVKEMLENMGAAEYNPPKIKISDGINGGDASSIIGGNKANIVSNVAKNQLGVPYVWGGVAPGVGLDCSGLTQYAYRVAGVSLPRVANDQWKCGVGTEVDWNDLKKGDQLFFGTDGHASHTGIYVGNGQMIHAPSTGDVVKYSSINTEYYQGKFLGAKRYAVGTPRGNGLAKGLGIAGENYKPEILVDKATGKKTYIDEPTVIDTTKTDVIGEKATARIPKFATGTPTTDPELLSIVKRVCEETGIPSNVLLAVIDQETGNKWYDKVSDGTGYSYGYMMLYDNGAIADIKANKGATAAELAKTDPYTNVYEGANLLMKLFSATGNWADAASAYNQGLGGLRKNGRNAYGNEVWNRANTEAFLNALNGVSTNIDTANTEASATPSIIETVEGFYSRTTDEIGKVSSKYAKEYTDIMNDDSLGDFEKAEALYDVQYRMGQENSSVGKIIYNELQKQFYQWLDDVEAGTEDWSLEIYAAYTDTLDKIKDSTYDMADSAVEAKRAAADMRWDNSNNWISDRNFYNDWELFDDSEVEAWGRVVKWLNEEYPNELEKIKQAEQNLFKAQRDAIEKSIFDIEDYISTRNHYDDWDSFGDSELEAIKRQTKIVEDAYKQRLLSSEEYVERLEEYSQRIYSLAQEQINESLSDIDGYISARNHYGDWDAFGDSEIDAIKRQCQILDEAYAQNLMSFEDYTKKSEAYAQKLYSIGQEYIDKSLSDIDRYIDTRNTYDDWDNWGDTEIEAIKRQMDILNKAYKENLMSLEDYTQKTEEYSKKLYSVSKDNIVKAISKMIEDYEEMRQDEKDALSFESTQYGSLKTLLQSHYDVVNAIRDAQHEINKELKASKTMYEYLNEETRKLLFNQDDYDVLNEKLLDIQAEANALQEQYNKDILGASEETIAEITSQYQMQYELLMKQYDIAKAELDVAKKRQKLDNVLAERNVRMFIDGEWQWVADTQKVIEAENELADAEIEREQRETSLKQVDSINKLTEAQDDITTQINHLESDLEKVREAWSNMQDMLNGESAEVAEALRQISEVASPELKSIIESTGEDATSFSTILKQVIEDTGGSVTSFSDSLSESIDAMSTVINTNLDTATSDILDNVVESVNDITSTISGSIEEIHSNISTGIGNINKTIASKLEEYSNAIKSLVDKINNIEVDKDDKDDDGDIIYKGEGGQTTITGDGDVIYVGGSSSSSSPSGKTVQVGSDGNAPSGTKVGDTVKTSGGDYLVVPHGTPGSNYNPASGLSSIKINADGSRYTSAGLNLMGEEGFEAFIDNNGHLIPINQPTIGNIGAGGIVFNQAQMKNLRCLWDLSNMNKILPHISTLADNKQSTVIDNSIQINGLTVGEQGNEDWINGLRRYVATHR